MAKYISNRQQNLKIGIVSYTEDKTVLEVIGNVGLGTTNPTSKLWVDGSGYFTGILTANRIFSSTYGEFVGGSISGTNIVGTALSVSGISTLGVTSATNLTSQQLNVSGITTVGFITTTNIYSSGVVTATTFYGTFTGNASSATFATSSGIATNLKGGSGGTIVYQSDTDRTAFLANGTGGYILQANGGTSAPSWVPAAAASAITGLTIRDGGAIVGGANSVSTLNFVGAIVSAASTAGIATITFLDYVGNAGISSALTSTASVNTTGILTATRLSTGASGTGINIDTNTISGPSILNIDPAGVGDNTGAVRIKGDLYVDGTQFVVNSSTIELADLRVGIATTVGTSVLLDGGGIGIGSANIIKTITWNHTAQALTSNADWNLESGKQYEIDNTPVLTSTTLGSAVVDSSLTSVGTLGQLNVSGFSTFSGITTHAKSLFGTQASFTGVVTATSFSGFGTNLTGIVTSIVAGTNISVSASTGQVTINSTVSGLDILEVMLFA